VQRLGSGVDIAQEKANVYTHLYTYLSMLLSSSRGTNAMETGNPPHFIADWYHSCITTFEQATECIDNLALEQDSDSDEAKALALQLIQDQIGRFRVWAANMGAHHKAASRMSLDYKLKEASHIHNTVVKLLTQLNNSLKGRLNLYRGWANC